MHKYCILILISLCTITNASGQFFQQENVNVLYSMGLHHGFSYLNALVDTKPDERIKFYAGEFEPYVSYYPVKNLGLGVAFSYEFVLCNVYKKVPFIEAGLFVRYYIPYVIDKPLFNMIHLFVELSYSKTNYRFVSYINNTITYKTWYLQENFIVSDYLDQNLFTVPFGFQVSIRKGLHFEIAGQYMIFPNGTKYFKQRIGIEYDFTQKSKE